MPYLTRKSQNYNEHMIKFKRPSSRYMLYFQDPKIAKLKAVIYLNDREPNGS